MLPTKTDAGRRGHESFERLIDRAMKIRTEQLAGYPRDKSAMSFMEFEALMIVSELCEAQEILYRNRIKNILMAGLGVKPEAG